MGALKTFVPLIDWPWLYIAWHGDIPWRWWWPPTRGGGVTSIAIGKLEVAWGDMRWADD